MSNPRFDDADEIAWTTDQGSDVTVEALNGALYVTLDGVDETGSGVAFERQMAELTTERGTDVLDAGHQRDESGKKFNAFVPLEVPRADVETLREESEVEPTDEPLAYEVEEREKKSSSDWGGTYTTQRLSATKPRREMTERQKELDRDVDVQHDVPEDAEAGDVFAVDELLDDPRTDEEREADALEEAAETDEDVVIRSWTEDCPDDDRECSLDHVRRVATPDGEVEKRRTHTY